MALLDGTYTRKQLSGQLMWGLSWIVISAIGFALHANRYGHGTHQQLGLPPCPSVLMTGRPCPGCGLTTSWTALLHGDIGEAFRAHLFGPILYAMFAVTGIMSLYGYATNRKYETSTTWATRILLSFVFLFMAYGAYRFFTTPNYAFPGEGVPPILAGK